MESDFHKFLQHYADLEAKVDFLVEKLIYTGLPDEEVAQLKYELKVRGAKERVEIAKTYRQVFQPETIRALENDVKKYEDKSKKS